MHSQVGALPTYLPTDKPSSVKEYTENFQTNETGNECNQQKTL